MFDFLQMALMGIQDPMMLATQMASQNIAPQVLDTAIGSMAQPNMGAMAPGGSIPMPDMAMGIPRQNPQQRALEQSGPGTQVAALDNGIFDGFMNTVKQKVTNPHGLAAVAATGLRESGFSAGNSFREWDDVGKPAGGIMSWRDGRLRSLKRFGGADDMKQLSPEIQGAFFLDENPSLIAQLNAAESNEQAMSLMNNAWQFKGFDDPNHPETKARMQAVNKVGPLFENMGNQDPNEAVAGQRGEHMQLGPEVALQQQQDAARASQIAGIDAEIGGGAGGAGLAMSTNAPKPQTLADKLAAIGKGLKVPEGGSAQEPPRITGGLAPDVGGGFGRDPQSLEKLFAMLGGTSPMQSPVPSLSQLIKGA
jgi:hypothetical protein